MSGEDPMQNQEVDKSTSHKSAGPNRPKEKDGWDKAGIIAQIVSGVLIATIGIIVTLKINQGQEKSAADQLTLQSQVAADQKREADKQGSSRNRSQDFNKNWSTRKKRPIISAK
jgi:hypothetical protein